MPFNCKYAIFDNDGTLMESMYYWRLGALEYIIAHSLPIPGEMTLEDMFSRSSRAFSAELTRFLPGVTYEEVVREMEERMGRHYRYDVVEKPGVGEFLAALKAEGAHLCVATAAPRELCRVALERLGIARYFDFVTDSYEVGMRKDDPQYFRTVAARLGAAPEACWVFEDALYAMQGAKAAGMRVCAIEEYTAKHQREEILAIADAYISDYRQPPRMLRAQAERSDI